MFICWSGYSDQSGLTLQLFRNNRDVKPDWSESTLGTAVISNLIGQNHPVNQGNPLYKLVQMLLHKWSFIIFSNQTSLFKSYSGLRRPGTLCCKFREMGRVPLRGEFFSKLGKKSHRERTYRQCFKITTSKLINMACILGDIYENIMKFNIQQYSTALGY